MPAGIVLSVLGYLVSSVYVCLFLGTICEKCMYARTTNLHIYLYHARHPRDLTEVTSTRVCTSWRAMQTDTPIQLWQTPCAATSLTWPSRSAIGSTECAEQ